MTPSSSKNIHVQYFALLREERGCSQETLTTTASTLSKFYEELQGKYKLSLSPALLRVAVNDQFQSWDKELAHNDTVVFIPPVAGG